ncbi:hypothetical protein [Tellurirhabdus rosea]|uniref:hypothetical protein n=1 Tax=Tellurirhabdus rosea TaxID=2674997 RepID=UPI00225326DA|nr:hypothetical protein [Tellurirhabdus rosea]
MATLSPSTTSYNESATLTEKYNQFAEAAEFNRVGWTATAMMIQGCLLSPVLLLTMMYFGGGDWQFLTGMLTFLLVIVPILGAQKMKYVFGGFLISLVVNLAMIALNVLSTL